MRCMVGNKTVPSGLNGVVWHPAAEMHPDDYPALIESLKEAGVVALYSMNPMFVDCFEPQNVFAVGSGRCLTEHPDANSLEVLTAGEFWTSFSPDDAWYEPGEPKP